MLFDQLMKMLDRISEINGLELKVSIDSDNNSIKVLHISTEHIKFVEDCDSIDKEIKPINPIYRGVGDLGKWWKEGPTCRPDTETDPESINTELTDVTLKVLDNTIPIPKEYLSTSDSVVGRTGDIVKRQEYTTGCHKTVVENASYYGPSDYTTHTSCTTLSQ